MPWSRRPARRAGGEDRHRVVFGTLAAVAAVLGMSGVSTAINTAFVERQHGTDRHRNARKSPQDVPVQ